jgi:TonB family protein
MDFGSREWRWSWSEAPSGVETAAPPESERPRVSAYERVEVVANAIYSSADPNVEAPEMVYPQLPPVPPDTADATAVNALQVVIGEDGSVERVRLVSTPRQMTDMLLLSAARTWRFTPARLNGVPVRYRATIRWAAEYPDRR